MLKGPTIHFLFIWWITFFKHLYSLMWDNRMHIEFNWLCKHKKKVRSSQASVAINSCTELSKSRPFAVILLNKGAFQKVHHSQNGIFVTLFINPPPPLPEWSTFEWPVTSNNVFLWFITFSGQHFRIGYRIEILMVPLLSNLCCSLEIPYAQKRCVFVTFGQIFRLMHGQSIWEIFLKRCLQFI